MQYSERLGRFMSPGESESTVPQTVVINGVSIPVPTPPTNFNTATEAELKSFIEAQALYEERVRDVTEGRERRDLLYEIPMQDLLALAQNQAREANAEEVRQLRLQNAINWMPTEPRWKDTKPNVDVLLAEMDRLNLRGYLTDFQDAFEGLVKRGALDVNYVLPTRKKVWTREELAVMEPQEMAEKIREMERDGVIGNLTASGMKKG